MPPADQGPTDQQFGGSQIPGGPADAGSLDDRPAAAARLARSAGLIGVATMVSRLLGLARDVVLAGLFGATSAMDAFYVAFRIPNLLRDLFAEGAMSAAFVPTFTRYLTLRGRADAWRLGNQVLNALLLTTGALVVAGIVFAEPLTQLMVADRYARMPGQLDLTVALTRTMLPFLSLVAIAVAFMGMLNSLNRFFIPALSPAMLNVATILCAFVLAPVMPAFGLHPVMAIAFGTLVGGLGQIALQWPVLHREGFRYARVLDPKDEGLRDILVLMGPGALGVAATQINLLVNTILATGEGEGAVSWLNYAFRMMYLPIGLFGVSVGAAALPEISRHAARKDLAGMRETISKGLRLMLMLNVPSTIGLFVLAHPIIAVIFERGRFTTADTAATAAALIFYSPGLVGYSAVKIVSPSFYALRDPRTPVIVSAITVGVNLVLNLVLVRLIGYRGLALGTALAAIFNAAVLMALLRGRLGGLDGRRLAVAFTKIAAASTVMAFAVIGVDGWLRVLLPGSDLAVQIVRLAASIATGVVILALAARALRVEEFEEALRRVSARLRRSP